MLLDTQRGLHHNKAQTLVLVTAKQTHAHSNTQKTRFYLGGSPVNDDDADVYSIVYIYVHICGRLLWKIMCAAQPRCRSCSPVIVCAVECRA